MNNQIKLNNHIHLGIQSMFFLWTVKYLTNTMHEVFHGLGGMLGGLKFMGFYMAVFGGGNSFVSSGSRTKLQSLFSSAAGPAVDLVMGLIVLFVILPRVKKYGFKIFWLFAAITTLLGFWGYMLIDGLGLSGGDFANISRYLGINRLMIGIVGLLGVIGFAFLVGRKIFLALFPYFMMNSFWERFGILLLFMGLPNFIYFGVIYFLDPGQTLIQVLLQSLMTIIVLALLGVFPQESGMSFQSLPRRPSFVGLLSFCAVCIIWLGVFGPTYQQAKGLLWITPDENSVSACNIIISLRQDFNASVDFLMRPYGVPLYWKKIKNQTPNWEFYEKFVDRNLPVLVGVSDYKIVDKINDTTSPFYYRTEDTGARRITSVVNLGEMMKRIEGDVYAFEITDFWRSREGYLEKLEVILEKGMEFSGYELVPNDAKKPALYLERQIMWKNKDKTAPVKVRLIFYLRRDPLRPTSPIRRF